MFLVQLLAFLFVSSLVHILKLIKTYIEVLQTGGRHIMKDTLRY